MELISLQKHDSQWVSTFAIEQKLITETLGKYVDKIHHVGSTAVPALLAKPIIDIAIESAFFPPSQLIIDKLATIGYQCRGEGGIPGRIWFTKGQPRMFNLHFCAVHAEIVRKQIIFRDRLTNSESLRREYEELKLKNYKGQDIDSSAYAFAKSDFIQKVIQSDPA